MTTHPGKRKEWRPRFTVRTLVVVMTLVCCYMACWMVTKRQGVSDVYYFAASKLGDQGHKTALDWQDFMPEFLNASASAPFLVGLDTLTSPTTRRYYFWFFGYVAELPFEREISEEMGEE